MQREIFLVFFFFLIFGSFLYQGGGGFLTKNLPSSEKTQNFFQSENTRKAYQHCCHV